jgi:hypothetical protein
MSVARVASIDVGYRNFCIAVEEYDLPIRSKNPEDIFSGRLKFFHNQDFGAKKKGADENPILKAILDWLEVHKERFDECDDIIIEQQLKTNPFAQKIEHMVHGWFLSQYGLTKNVGPFSATHKTRVLNAPKKMNKPERKAWSVEKATEILTERGDDIGLQIMDENKKKADDLGDCLLMCQAFKILNIGKLVKEKGSVTKSASKKK